MSTPTPSGLDGEETASRQLKPGIVILLASLSAIGALSTNIILPSFPSMASELGVTTRDLGVTLTSFFVAFAIGQLFVGPLSDRFGRRALVFGGLAVFLLGTAICALAEALSVLIAGRVVQAIGVCAASVLSRAIARDLFSGEALSRALALTMVAMAAAPGFSPLLGSGLDRIFGWRSTFVAVGLCGVVTGILYAIRLGETHPSDRRVAHTPGEVGHAYLALAFDLRFILPAMSVSLVIGALFALFGASPAILIGLLGLTPVQLGLFFAATVLVVFGAGFSAPPLAHRWGAANITIAGAILAVLGGFLLLAVPAVTLPAYAFATAVFLFGMGLVNPLGTGLALQPFGQQAGLASALLGFLQMACAAIATALTAKLSVGPVAALGGVTVASSIGALVLVFGVRSSSR